ncbi:MAG: ABC transporter permease [Niameybacter sp.]|uniref:ABC transporter permease n=1 Tax=Niameybacter sp. TaxID=2033640 RepID=UPI002FC9ABE7
MKPSMLQQSKQVVKKGFIIFIWIMVWQCVHSFVGKDILVPSPYATLNKLLELMEEVRFYQEILLTFYRVGMGVALSVGIGCLSALGACFFRWFREILAPLIILLKSTPVIAIIILALLWFSKDTVPIFVCFLMCYPVMYTNVLKGLQCVDQELLEMVKVFNVKRSQVIRAVYMPQVKPYIEAGLGMVVGLSWKVVIAAEVLAVPRYSMGYNLLSAKSYLETETLFAWVVVIVVLSGLCEYGVMRLLERRKK